MAIHKCGECDGSLDLLENGLGKCQYCGAFQTLPKDNDERISQILNRANDFRKVCDFDRAIFEYEKVLELDETEPEAHWGIFLSRYGVEYVKDTISLAYKPTLHRISSVSVFDDVDYQATLKYASPIAKEQYISKAALIEQVMKNFLITSANEEPYDIFISYKELDDVTRLRTDDSYLAHDLYNVLTAEGYKVFFAPKSLVGVKHFEPKIYSAIISSKAMIVLGTKPEYLEGVWVKNEWSRFAELIEKGEDKIIIPVFKTIEAKDLPIRFSSYQAYKWDDISFLEDVKAVLAKWVKKESKIEFDKNTSAEAAFIERGFIALEDREFSKADSFFENALNLNPHSSQAYFGKLMVEMGVSKKEQILTAPQPLNAYKNFEKAVRFADQQQKIVLLQYEEKVQYILDEQVYNKAIAIINGEDSSEEDYVEAAEIFNSIIHFNDAKEKEEFCYSKIDDFEKEKVFQKALILEEKCKNNYYEEDLLVELIELLKTIPGWKTVDEKLDIYQKKLDKINLKKKKRQRFKKKFIKVSVIFVSITVAIALFLNFVVWPIVQPPYEMNRAHKILLKQDGTVIVEGFSNGYGEDKVSDWTDIVAIAGDYDNTIGLKPDGAVVAVGDNEFGQCNVEDWTDIVTVYFRGNVTYGLKADGTVVAVGDNEFGECNVGDWTNIVDIKHIWCGVIGLKSDGTVVTAGEGLTYSNKCDLLEWTDIVAIDSHFNSIFGLKSDGTVVVSAKHSDDDDYDYGIYNVDDWTDIVSISAGDSHVVGLKSDGTVVAAGYSGRGRCDVESWTDIVAIFAGQDYTIGLKSDGTVVSTNENYDLSNFTGVIEILDIDPIIGLKADNTLVFADYDWEGEYDKYKDENIVDWIIP